MATLLGGKIIDSAGTSPILGSPSNLGTVAPNALTNSSTGINPNANANQVLNSGVKLGDTPATPAPVSNAVAPTTTPVVAKQASTSTAGAAPVSTKSIYRVGNDIYDAQTNQKIANPTVLAKDYAGAKEVAAPTTTKPAETTTTPDQGSFDKGTGISGYDNALAADKEKQATADAQKATDNANNVSSLLSQGYATADSIATATGMTTDEVNKLINNDESLSYKLNINKNADKQDQTFNDYNNKINSITNGTFALTASEQADIKSIQDSFDRMKAAQLEANQNYEGAVQTGEIRSGRQEFMNQISSGIYKQAVDSGVQKITDIESKAAAAIRDYKDAVEAKNFKAAYDQFTVASNYLSQKSDAIKELHAATTDELKRQQDAVKAANDQITASLNQQKLSQDIAKSTVDSLTPALAGASDEVIQDLASYYGIDPNLLTSSVIGTSQKFEQDMIAKGYRTINPADVDKMRATGADVVTYSGRAYMKEPELKSFTNKGNVDFYKGTQKVGSSTLTGGGGSGGTSSVDKETKAIQDDINTIQEKYTAGTYEKEAARKMLWSRYGASPQRPGGLTNETISILIPD